jgi:hypothetical protein
MVTPVKENAKLTIVSWRDDFFTGPADAALWNQLTRAFGLPCVKFFDDGNISLNDNVVVFDENGSVCLRDFEHPDNATYIFGCTGMRDIHHEYPHALSVRIEVPHLISKQGLFGHQAAAIVLYDKENKRWQSQ